MNNVIRFPTQNRAPARRLSERLISRLSPLQRVTLSRRCQDRVKMLGMMHSTPANFERYDRAVCVRDRLATIIG